MFEQLAYTNAGRILGQIILYHKGLNMKKENSPNTMNFEHCTLLY